VRAGVAQHEVSQGIGDRGGEHVRQPQGHRHAQSVSEPARVLDRGPGGPAPDRGREHAPGCLELPEPGLELGRGGRGRIAGGNPDAPGQLRLRQRPQHTEQVGDVVGIACRAPGIEVLEFGLGARERVRVEQVGEGQALAAAQQLGEEHRIERQGRGPPLGERGVALVEELRHVAEQQRLRERRRGGGLDLDHPDGARADLPEQVDQAGYVEHVLHALPHRLEHDGEGGVLRRHAQQLRRPLPLLPQGLPLVGPAPRQQEGPSGAFAEA
jgi:hypothetical protein